MMMKHELKRGRNGGGGGSSSSSRETRLGLSVSWVESRTRDLQQSCNFVQILVVFSDSLNKMCTFKMGRSRGAINGPTVVEMTFISPFV